MAGRAREGRPGPGSGSGGEGREGAARPVEAVGDRPELGGGEGDVRRELEGGEGDVRLELRDGVAVATLHRPEVLNAFREVTVEALLAALDRVAGDPDIRALVLTGAGRAFSAGIDLREMEAHRARGETEEEARARLERLQELTRRIVASPAPVIAAVNGPAVGLGAELCVAADLRLVAEGASFAFPEVRRGLSGTNGVAWLLPRIVGLGRALDWFLTGRTVDAVEAAAAGLASDVVPAERLLPAALERAREVAAAASTGVAAAKELLHGSGGGDLETTLRREVEVALDCMRSPEYEEGLRSFLEKRPADFRRDRRSDLGRGTRPESPGGTRRGPGGRPEAG